MGNVTSTKKTAVVGYLREHIQERRFPLTRKADNCEHIARATPAGLVLQNGSIGPGVGFRMRLRAQE